jgi:mono/diheme cytochrome c family protein
MKLPTMTLRTLLRLATTALAALASTAALADNPVNGASLYATHCASCHGSTPLTSNGSKIYFGRNARGVIETAIATNNSGMGALRPSFPTNGTQIADVAAYLGNSPSTLTFPSTNVGTTSASTQNITVTASLKGAAYAIGGLSVAPIA